MSDFQSRRAIDSDERTRAVDARHLRPEDSFFLYDADNERIEAQKAIETTDLYVTNDLTVSGEIFGPGTVPVGSIIAWYPNIVSPALSLPSHFLECDGQTVDDADSPLDGVTLPDLNGDKRFLRGADNGSEGVEQADATAVNGMSANQSQHRHYMKVYADNLGWGKLSDLTSSTTAHSNEYSSYTDPAISLSGDSETRPINFSVVWIIRIK